MSQEAPPVRKDARGSITLLQGHLKSMRILIKMMEFYKFHPKFFYNIPNSADIWYTKNEYV